MYDFSYPGGVPNLSSIKRWQDLINSLDRGKSGIPVDSDQQGIELNLALAGHKDNFDVYSFFSTKKYRDEDINNYWAEVSPWVDLPKINESKVAIYNAGGWYDSFALDTLLWYRNIVTPKKLIMGPWSHIITNSEIFMEKDKIQGTEMIRWFDYWLKDIENGVMEESPIHYATIANNGNFSWSWKSSESWPPENVSLKTYFLSHGFFTTDFPRINALVHELPIGLYDLIPAVNDASLGTSTRWQNIVGIPFRMPEMSSYDESGLIYYTEDYVNDFIITGSVILRLFIASSQSDFDIHATLQDQNPDGETFYITEGHLRASNGQLGKPNYDRIGLPYHSSSSTNRIELNLKEPKVLEFDFLPVSYKLEKGHRLVLTLHTSDTGTFDSIHLVENCEIRVFHTDQFKSVLLVPEENK